MGFRVAGIDCLGISSLGQEDYLQWAVKMVVPAVVVFCAANMESYKMLAARYQSPPLAYMARSSKFTISIKLNRTMRTIVPRQGPA